MQYKRFSIELELTGVTGKKAAEVLSECFNNPVEYDGAYGIYGKR